MSGKLTRIFLWGALLAIVTGIAVIAIGNTLSATWQERAVLIGATLVVPVPIILAVLGTIAAIFEQR
jgi:hypothetical protein